MRNSKDNLITNLRTNINHNIFKKIIICLLTYITYLGLKVKTS